MIKGLEDRSGCRDLHGLLPVAVDNRVVGTVPEQSVDDQLVVVEGGLVKWRLSISVNTVDSRFLLKEELDHNVVAVGGS